MAARPARAAVVAASAALATQAPGIADAADASVDALSQPRMPAPLVLPELAHPRTDVALTWTAARGATNVAGRPAAAIGLVRAHVEGSIFARRRVYLGVTYDFAAALPPDGGLQLDDRPTATTDTGSKTAFGNVAPHVRAVFPITEGLAFGFVLGSVLPTSTTDRNGPAQSAMYAAASLEPTDYVHFLPGRWAVRPAGDLRIVRGPFVLQARQGFDFMIDEAGIERARTAGRVLVHAGIVPTRSVELSIEATQIYFFFTEEPAFPPDPSLPAAEQDAIQRRNAARERYRISDDRRTAFTIGPSVRLSFPNVDVGAGLVTNLGSPLSPALDSFVAARLSVVAHFR